MPELLAGQPRQDLLDRLRPSGGGADRDHAGGIESRQALREGGSGLATRLPGVTPQSCRGGCSNFAREIEA